ESIPYMAVGVALTVSPKHRKLYVARGNFPHRDSETGRTGSPLSIIDLHSHRELMTHTLQTSVGLAVLTPDENYVLVGNGERITIIDTSTDMIVDEFDFGDSLLGLAIAKNNAVYVLLPELQIKLLGLNGLIRAKR